MVLRVCAIFCLVAGALATGCGEPFVHLTDSCTDEQCSRAVVFGDRTFCVRGRDKGEPCLTTDDCYMRLTCTGANSTNEGTCTKSDNVKVAWKGYAAVGVAVLAFGSNFIPARRVDPGNGLFFQFCMSAAILSAGFAVQMVRGASIFYPYAMLGGMLWCLGNTLAVPAIHLISMGLGVSLWGGSNMMLGWASGHFGFWGITKETVEVPWISYVGLGFSAVGVIVLAFVKKSNSHARHSEDGALIDIGYTSVSSSTVQAPASNPFDRVELGEKEDISDYLSKGQQRALGIFLAVSAGCFFGVNFDPPTLLMDEYAERSLKEDVKYSPDGLDYVFSHFFGIFCTALVELIIFTGVDTFVNLPSLFAATPYTELILPGFFCGLGWSIGMISWFIANDNLGLVISFPIVTLGPSIVASLWSVFLFREIRGLRNFIVLGVAFVMLAVSATCTVFARNGF